MPDFTIEDVMPLHLADVTFPHWHPLYGQSGEVFAFALRHPTGLILYETGIGPGNPFLDETYQIVHRSLAAELDAHDLHVTDVRAVVNSHLHFDHCGNNPLFGGIPIFAQRVEYDAAHQPHYTVPDWVDFHGAEYAMLDGDAQVAAGVRVMSTPGHSPGHQSLVLDTTDGLVALAGQAIYAKAEYEHIRRTGTLTSEDPPSDPDQYLASAGHVIALGARRVYFSHDQATWDAPPIAPSA